MAHADVQYFITNKEKHPKHLHTFDTFQPRAQEKGRSVVIYTHCPALLIGFLGWRRSNAASLCVTAEDLGVQGAGEVRQAAWKGPAEHAGGSHSHLLSGAKHYERQFFKITISQVFACIGGFVSRSNVYGKSCSSGCHGCDLPPVHIPPSHLPPIANVCHPARPSSAQTPSLLASQLSFQPQHSDGSQAVSTWHPNIWMRCKQNKQMFLLHYSRCLGKALSL